MADKQSNQQRVNELAKSKGARIERINGCLVHTQEGILIARSFAEAEEIIKNLPSPEKQL